MKICINAVSNDVKQYKEMLEEFKPIFHTNGHTNYAVIHIDHLSDLAKLLKSCQPFSLLATSSEQSTFEINLEIYDSYIE